MNKDERIINCLIVSDIHEDISALTKIPLQNNNKFDYCFALGDYMSLDANQVDKKEYLTKGENTIKDIITILERLSNEVLYIAGNHDPASFYTNQSIRLSDDSHYLHKKYYKLDDDLYIAGIGGSVMAVVDGTKEKVWDGYPYNQQDNLESDSAFKNDVIETLELIKADPDANKKKMVLLTHNGPQNNTTTKSTHSNKVVQSGSAELCNIINKNKDIILNIHGHTHDGYGQFRLNDTVIANPGSVRDKRYAIITLSKITKDEWRISVIAKSIN